MQKQRHYSANKDPSSQGYGFSSSHVWMSELDCEEGWALKNWCFWTVVLEKTLESPLDCKENQPVHSKGDQSLVFFGRNDAKAETPVLWPTHAKSWLTGKDSDAGRDWGQEEKGTTEDEMAGWHHWLDGLEFEWTLAVDGQGGLACCNSWGRKESDTTERLNWTELIMMLREFLISSILSCHNKNLKRQTNVTAPYYSSVLFRYKGKYIIKVWGNGNPKDTKRKEATGPILAPLFICFFLPHLGLPYVNWASQECCLFYLRSSLLSSDLCYILVGFSLPCLSATTILDFFFLF